jgi:hypothetical protein
MFGIISRTSIFSRWTSSTHHFYISLAISAHRFVDRQKARGGENKKESSIALDYPGATTEPPAPLAEGETNEDLTLF